MSNDLVRQVWCKGCFWSICVINVYSCPSSNLSGKYINTLHSWTLWLTNWMTWRNSWDTRGVCWCIDRRHYTLIVYSVNRMLTRWFSILWDSSCFSLFKRISNYQLNFIIMMCSYHNIFIDGKINYCKYRYCNTWLFWDTGENISSMIWTCIS